MPQMAPYNWFILFLMFNMINIVIISMNYYMKMDSNKFYLKIKLFKKYNFKW